MRARFDGIALQVGIDLDHHPVLVALGVDGRDLPLREGVVERVVDRLGADAEAGSRLPVDLQRQLQAAGLAIAGDVGDAFHRLQPLLHDRRPFAQQVQIGADQRELVVGIALPPAGAHVLGREHEQPHARAAETAFAAADRSPAACVTLPSRSAIGFREMNIEPRFWPPPQPPPPPSDEPIAATA